MRLLRIIKVQFIVRLVVSCNNIPWVLTWICMSLKQTLHQIRSTCLDSCLERRPRTSSFSEWTKLNHSMSWIITWYFICQILAPGLANCSEMHLFEEQPTRHESSRHAPNFTSLDSWHPVEPWHLNSLHSLTPLLGVRPQQRLPQGTHHS